MDVAVAVIAFLVLFSGLAALIVVIGQVTRGQGRAEAVKRAQVKQAAAWRVELNARPRAFPAGTQIVVRKVTDDGELLGQVVVASVRDDAPGWEELMVQARIEAESRAQLLNSQM
jgi:hypothetical protein